MRSEIYRLIDDFGRLGWQSNPYDLTLRLIDSQSEEIVTLVEMVLDHLPDAGTFFSDAISFVPEREMPRLAGLAMNRLRDGRETAEEFIAYCSLQQVEALHPFLPALWDLKPNGQSYYADWPWRGSGLAHFDFLSQIADGHSGVSGDARDRLLETRHPLVLEHLTRRPELMPDDFFAVGFEANPLRQLFANDVRHFIFPNDYWDPAQTPAHMVKRHPTWSCAGMPRTDWILFGGRGTHVCAACGKQGHRLFALTEVPAVTQIGPLSLETCLSCLGWEAPSLFYQHDQNGNVLPIAYEGTRIEPQFPSPPLLEVQVQLAQTPGRWQWQDWGLSNGRQNLHRFGGHPCWIQDAKYLQCPCCQCTMSFLFQLDSNLALASENSQPPQELLWGSGGICYGQWCDRCKVSGYLWQCT